MTSNGTTAFVLPKIPVPHKDFVPYINQNQNETIQSLTTSYNVYEARLREGFAQHRDHEALQDPFVNAVPLFHGGHDVLHIHSRSTDDANLNEKYVMPLKSQDRKLQGAQATVGSLQDFKKNFNLFSESSLADLDWSNVVAAGSSVVTALLPVPDEHNTSKKALREYYHKELAPSSDVDLFIWGLDEAAALEKIKQIESSVRNAILEEVTVVRTKNAITIASHYPIRHVQIVLRLYKSVSEILTGFDVDCSCFAYDGSQVYGTPRAIAALMTQTNTIDLSRRSPSYESRLSKYARRGFEVYWPELDRSKIDPTIFERSFARTMGLARLLVLEQLPKPSDREEYLEQRREERGRPIARNRYWNRGHALPDNVKDQDPDDIAEWVYDDEISNYHSFTVPYGPKYTAKKIEKLLYTKDLLLNAEWNQNKDRTVHLHRHPCFIGPIDSVVHDCCGFCPKPTTEEEREVAEEESKIYVFGDLAFMKDDPGRQAIGSFNPLTDDDWTDMAYIGNTQELCQKICDGDLDFVEDWCEKHPDSIDRRDHTGRTPLHLAAQCSTPEILECLVDHGARIVARLVDGMTALHVAAARGQVEMVATLLEQSEENEAEEAEKEDMKRIAKRKKTTPEADRPAKLENIENDDSDDELDDASSDEVTAVTEGSFVNVSDKKSTDEDALDGNEDAEPDIYDVNVVTWDTPVSALHLAILGGHTRVIKLLIGNFGADALLPVKIVDSYTRNPEHAIMTLILAAKLSPRAAEDTTQALLDLGASSAQGDMHQITALHYLVAARKIQLLKLCLADDGAAARTALNHVALNYPHWRPKTNTPLTTAIRSGNSVLVTALLHFGANPIISLDDFAAVYTSAKETSTDYWRNGRETDVSEVWKNNTEQPVFLAVEHDMPDAVLKMVNAGGEANSIDTEAHEAIARLKEYNEHDTFLTIHGRSLLDAVQERISSLEYAIDSQFELAKPIQLADWKTYVEQTAHDSYERWYLSKAVEVAKNIVEEWQNWRKRKLDEEKERSGKHQRLEALRSLHESFTILKEKLLQKGAKTLEELYPEWHTNKRDEEYTTKEFQKQEKAFQPKVTFQASTTDQIRDGYLQLFEAAWAGDIAKLKQLTLANWGPDRKHGPLLVATQDSNGFTPFAIAMYRRHLEVAKILLEIADVQFKGPDGDSPRRRYTIEADESDYSSDEDDNLGITSQIVDETFTIDNIVALRQSVGSKVSASEMLSKQANTWCLFDSPEKEALGKLGYNFSDVYHHIREGNGLSNTFKSLLDTRGYASTHFVRYALASRDIELLRFYLRCCQDASKAKVNSNTPSFSGFDSSDFQFAIEHGYTEELSEMIRIAGAELPLDTLVKQSGVQEEETPKHYQGLSIGGKKMTSWARERGRNYQQAMGESTPPLLQSAYRGGLAAVEWFLSDTPFRFYKEYGANNAEDSRLKTLAKAKGGLEEVVSSWLKQRSNLSLHATILSPAPHTTSLYILKYLLSIFPESINTPSQSNSLTPLALSFLTGRTDTARTLIEAGADQTTRDITGKNLVHLALIAVSKTSPIDSSKFRSLLSSIDKRLLASMFTERCRDNPGGLTPLAFWLSSIFSAGRYGRVWDYRPGARLVPEILSIMLEFGGTEALTMMDGSGQFPLHQAVKHSCLELVKLMLDHDQALLSRENAMGQTPFELAQSLYVRDCTEGNPDIWKDEYKNLENQPQEEFVLREELRQAYSADDEDENEIRKMWKICDECALQNSMPRKLVSVSEAREVARRLAERKRRTRVDGEEEDANVRNDVSQDEVARWLGHGALQMG